MSEIDKIFEGRVAKTSVAPKRGGGERSDWSESSSLGPPYNTQLLTHLRKNKGNLNLE